MHINIIAQTCIYVDIFKQGVVFDDLIPKTGIPTSKKHSKKKVEVSRISLYHTKRIGNVKN